MGDSEHGSPRRSVAEPQGLGSEPESEPGAAEPDTEPGEDLDREGRERTVIEGWLKHRDMKKVSC